MNPISAMPGTARAAGAPDTSPVPSDLAGLFAMMFAATTAAPPPLPVVPVVVQVTPESAGSTPRPDGVEPPPSTNEDAPRAEGEVPPTLPGGWPSREPSGSQANPGLATTGRPRLERPGLTPALEHLAPVRPAPMPPADGSGIAHAAPPTPRPATGMPEPPPPPDGMRMPTPSERAPVLAAAIAAALPQPAQSQSALTQLALPAAAARVTHGAPGIPTPGTPSPSGEGTLAGEPLLADVARDGVHAARARTPQPLPPADGAAGQPGRGRGKGVDGLAKDREPASEPARDSGAAAVPVLPDVAPVPAPGTTSTAAHAAYAIAPHASQPPELPVTTVAAPAAPTELPPEPQRIANPSHATVSFDSGDGQEGRLRVSLRGDTLRATLQMPDAAAAQRLEQDLGELSRVLRSHGFEDTRLTIDAPRSASNSERRHDDTPSREHKNLRDERSHSGERHPSRRERGSSRQER